MFVTFQSMILRGNIRVPPFGFVSSEINSRTCNFNVEQFSYEYNLNPLNSSLLNKRHIIFNKCVAAQLFYCILLYHEIGHCLLEHKKYH